MTRSGGQAVAARDVDPEVFAAVADGLGRTPRTLPAWLFYDDRGSDLFEQITALPEYYLTRAEREILERHADEIVALAAEGTDRPLHVVELGAGSALKSQILLRAVVRRQGRCLYLPVD
ncbi:MAG: L-histidine N(alpha)-methyltransferase, partial [Myxococcota bacterium]